MAILIDSSVFIALERRGAGPDTAYLIPSVPSCHSLSVVFRVVS